MSGNRIARIDVHPDRRLFMLPQRPYVPSGTLRRATAYPGAADDWTAEEIKKVLDKVGRDQPALLVQH